MPTTTTAERLAWLDGLTLDAGGHPSRRDGACAMEAAAYIAGEKWSAHPSCVSPAIAAFMRAWNDALDDDRRQILKPYIPRVIGTATGEADEETRAWLATDWLVRTFAPAWLDRASLGDDAARLRALPELASSDLAAAAIGTINDVRERAAAARDAAWDAARAAAGAALAPTVVQLQESALLLLEAMISVGRDEPAVGAAP